MTSGAATHNERLTEELMKPEGERDPSVLNQARSLPHLTSHLPPHPDNPLTAGAQSADEYAEMKELEFRQVCALFGCTDARILPFKDKPFKKSDEAVEAVRNIIYETRPN